MISFNNPSRNLNLITNGMCTAHTVQSCNHDAEDQ